MEYVDRESLVWRSALCPTELGLLLEHKSEHKVRDPGVAIEPLDPTRLFSCTKIS